MLFKFLKSSEKWIRKNKKKKGENSHAQILHDLSCNTAWYSGHGCRQPILGSGVRILALPKSFLSISQSPIAILTHM
jgi:hypothetical protein